MIHASDTTPKAFRQVCRGRAKVHTRVTRSADLSNSELDSRIARVLAIQNASPNPTYTMPGITGTDGIEQTCSDVAPIIIAETGETTTPSVANPTNPRHGQGGTETDPSGQPRSDVAL